MQKTQISKVSIDEVTVNRRRGGAIRVLLSPKTVGSTSGFFGVLTLEPGEYVSEHYHPYSEEFMYVVTGKAEAVIDRHQVITLESGEGLMVPINVRHRVTNVSGKQTVINFHLSPLAPRPDLGHVDTEELPSPAESLPDVGSSR